MKTLTDREMQVAELLAWGQTDKEIAGDLEMRYINFKKNN